MSFYKKILNENHTDHKLKDDEIRQIQRCLSVLLREIIEVCEKYDIKPILAYGSCLGLIRHKGFIPWDDDLDLFMLREDYEKFARIFDAELSDRYVISDPVGSHVAYNRFIQIGRKGTSIQNAYSESTDENIPTNHIYIDIFPLDYVPDNPFLRWIKGTYSNFIMMISGCVAFKMGENNIKKRFFKKTVRGQMELMIRMILGSIFSYMSPDHWFHYLDTVVTGKDKTDLIASTLGPKHFFGDINRTSVFLPLKECIYEEVNVYIPNAPDAYLTKSYGNYMEIPPIEKRESHYAVAFRVLDDEKNNLEE